jgi:exosortase A-associated hydrolase 1
MQPIPSERAVTHKEEVLCFNCQGAELLGILSLPAGPTPVANVGLVIIVGGPQYRVGAHRQFVLLARRLAGAGFPVLRFDHRGVGDSATTHPGFESIGRDVQSAVQAMVERLPQLSNVVLFGLCDAASAALLYYHQQRDARVSGMVLANPWVRSPETLARAHLKHYYLDRLKQGSFWRKALRGELTPGTWQVLGANVRAALFRSRSPGATGFQRQMAQAWMHFPGRLLLLLSEHDYTAKEFVDVATTQSGWRGALTRHNLQRVDLSAADHTFSSAVARGQMEDAVLHWLRQAQQQQSTLGRPQPASRLDGDNGGRP